MEASARGSGRWGAAARAGVAGAAAVTALNELGRRLVPGAPHAERLGVRGVRSVARLAGRRPPRGRRAFRWALLGEALSNSSYYALVAIAPRRPLAAGALLGAAAGLGAVYLPERLGLGADATRRTARTARLAFAWYALGGLAAGLVFRNALTSRARRAAPSRGRTDPAYTAAARGEDFAI
jgi:hypothetical protein